MSSARYEWKVGLFVFIGLVLLATLLLEFSKGASLFAQTYELRLVTSNAGAIKPKAAVLMAGLPVGSVLKSEFNPDNKSVMIYLTIYRRFPIQTNSVFGIDQSGFLGDQFVAVTPGPRVSAYFNDGAIIDCQPPFNLLDAARSAMGLMQGVDNVVGTMDQMLKKIDRTILNQTNLAIITNAFASLTPVSERLRSVVSNVDLLVHSNRPAIDVSLHNLTHTSSNLSRLTASAQALLDTNQPEIRATMTNLAAITRQTRELLAGLEAGQGLAGSLLQDKVLRQEFAASLTSLTVLSSNLARFGLLYKPKPVKTTTKRGYLITPGRGSDY